MIEQPLFPQNFIDGLFNKPKNQEKHPDLAKELPYAGLFHDAHAILFAEHGLVTDKNRDVQFSMIAREGLPESENLHEGVDVFYSRTLHYSEKSGNNIYTYEIILGTSIRTRRMLVEVGWMQNGEPEPESNRLFLIQPDRIYWKNRYTGEIEDYPSEQEFREMVNEILAVFPQPAPTEELS
jgi:hypothetical protein